MSVATPRGTSPDLVSRSTLGWAPGRHGLRAPSSVPAPDSIDLGLETVRLRERLPFWASQPPSALLAQRDALRCRMRLSATAQSQSQPIQSK
jgi:hypothetical protein